MFAEINVIPRVFFCIVMSDSESEDDSEKDASIKLSRTPRSGNSDNVIVDNAQSKK